MIRGVRGAITVEDNTEEAIQAGVRQLMDTLLKKNAVDLTTVCGVFFTLTPDLTAYNPAKACRGDLPQWQDIPMLCSQEPEVTGMMTHCIRVLVQWDCPDTNHPITPIYLGNAQQLRPDLCD